MTTDAQTAGARPLEGLLDDLPYPLVGLGPDWTITLINRQAELVCGHPAEGLVGQAYHALFPEGLPGSPDGARVTCKCRNGETFPAEVAAFALPTGEPDGLLLQLHTAEGGPEERPGAAGFTPQGRDLLYTEAVLRAQLETSPDAIVVADWDHNVLAWNQRFLAMWGLAEATLANGRGELALQAVADLPADPGAFQAEVRRLYRHLEEPEEGVEIPLKDGRILERYSRGVQDERGLFWGRAWYYRDITQRKWAESALTESEQRFRAIFERAALGIAVAGPDGRPVAVNPALARMLGRTETELCGMPFEAFTHPDDVAQDRALFEELKAGERASYQITKRFLTADGGTIRGRLSASLLPGLAEDGGPLFLALVEDVTEHTALEEGLRLVAEVLRSANGVMVTDARGRILRINDAFTRITGYTADEVIGEQARIIDAEPDDPAFYRDLMAALGWQDTWEGEIQARRQDGSRYPLWETVTAIRDEAGRVVRYVAVFMDLTERKMLASERRRRSSAIGELGRLLAHQINQPLAAIGGYAEGARMRVEKGQVAPDELVSILERIGDQARRAAEVVADMRHYFRGEPLERVPVGLNTLLHDIRPVLPDAEAADYRLELDLADDLDPVLADPIQVQECLINLITNAVEAGPPEVGGPTGVRVATRQADGMVEVAIRDWGPGVPPGLEEKIFQPMFGTKGAGSGLGLPICLFVAEEHGGHLWMTRNAPEPGVTFHLTLPVAEPDGA
jgi:PAS domain S-box-containing protein